MARGVRLTLEASFDSAPGASVGRRFPLAETGERTQSPRVPQDIDFWMVAGSLVLAVVVFGLGLASKSAAGPSPVPPPLPRGPGWGGWRVNERIFRSYDLVLVMGLLFLYASPLALELAGKMPEGPVKIGAVQLTQTIVMQFLLMGGVIAVVAWRKSPVEWLGLRWRGWLSVFLIAPVAVAVTWAFMVGMQLSGLVEWLVGPGGAAEQQEVVKAFAEAEDPLTFILLCLTAVVVAPVTEEVIFRGYFYPVAKRFTGRWAAVLFSSLVFAMVHHSAVALLPLCFLAVLLALSYELTGSIWAPVGIHVLFNAATVAMQVAMRFEWIVLPEG